MIIGFSGHKGSGKDTAAAAIPGAHHTKMADPLKNMLRALYQSAGVDEETIERKIEGDLKEEPCEILLGKTPRFAMQTLGHEWRNFIGETLWSTIWLNKVSQISILDTVIVSDVRYPHEVEAVKELGGLVVRIERPGQEVDLSHGSERMIADLTVDISILNTGTVDELHGRVREILE